MTAITSIMVILVASLGIGLMAQDSYAQLPEYEVKVTFDSITIHNDHEGAASGDGEFDLSAFVQGKRVDLTGGTGYACTRSVYNPQMHTWTQQPSWCERLWDAQEGKTYQFNPGTEVTVLVPENVPLSFLIGGGEDDGEGRYWYPAREKYFKELADLLQDPVVLLDKDKVDNIKATISGNLQVHSFCSFPTLNCNDNIGDIQVYYEAPDYGKGSHEEKANLNDYTLRYTISASPIESTCNNNLPVNSATSSGNLPTFLPNNAIDNNPNTWWWSNITVNPFITLDLGTSKSVCGVDIAWADGNSHPYKFDVSVSTDGTSFTKVLSATSTGNTTSPEKYNFPPTQAKYVKITITESTAGAPRSIAEISEIDVFG
jgi:hypothetical protein